MRRLFVLFFFFFCFRWVCLLNYRVRATPPSVVALFWKPDTVRNDTRSKPKEKEFAQKSSPTEQSAQQERFCRGSERVCETGDARVTVHRTERAHPIGSDPCSRSGRWPLPRTTHTPTPGSCRGRKRSPVKPLPTSLTHKTHKIKLNAIKRSIHRHSSHSFILSGVLFLQELGVLCMPHRKQEPS